MKLLMAYTTFGASLLLLIVLALAGCVPDTPSCTTNIAGSQNTVSCGGGGDNADVTNTPAPVVVPPVVVPPVVVPPVVTP